MSMRPYTPEWLSMPVAYVAEVALAVDALEWWDDPFDPRDATILLVSGAALVWDEESGWRHGRFVSGEKGVRTVLADPRYLGGGVLPRPADVPVLQAMGGSPVRPHYRSYRDYGDGLDERLATYTIPAIV
ncbi:DUF6292 family protein [Nonomuraea africana]|uniref:DUF6292 domain-containing protein n=1 Tax=Nonomuraea africana TaxID=46171 RepID=A0ABR9KPC3_9ACTN|nr:DUF6292 family protein [Nonomuraea africana]MBE1563458.1 hypothetical protein [Nonomuraea africana]